MYDYHVSYYDPFPYQKNYATSDWNEVLDILKKYKNVTIHLHNSIRNRSSCPYCNEDN